ncbi:hypothetical protein ACPOL_4441 [Acidisarcina polymorpha]|uniref:Uncharacterized protein n=1 Tax=Acidisarcina polymorpha TaxID=2211140 RepID=A0A2Z5G4F3_9BACT|nr:hypothetical protein ACPOL_4441 [Acidisarcina polymorpha]
MLLAIDVRDEIQHNFHLQTSFPALVRRATLRESGVTMRKPVESLSGETPTPSMRRFASSTAPRKHLRVLPTRTRPSLFGD